MFTRVMMSPYIRFSVNSKIMNIAQSFENLAKFLNSKLDVLSFQTPFHIISIFMSDLYNYFSIIIWWNKNYNSSSYFSAQNYTISALTRRLKLTNFTVYFRLDIKVFRLLQRVWKHENSDWMFVDKYIQFCRLLRYKNSTFSSF